MGERMLLRFSKQQALRFAGHLDLLRVLQRTVSRAALPVAYSQGFNPHRLLSFALPLPLGMASEHDYAELTLDKPVEPGVLLEQLNAHTPDGLTFTGTRFMPNSEPRIASVVAAADYRLALPDTVTTDAVTEALQSLLAETVHVIPKKTKSGVKDTDIRPDILDLMHMPSSEPCVVMRLAAGSARFLNPQVAAGLVLARMGVEIPEYARVMKRMELYKQIDSALLSLYVAEYGKGGGA